MALLSSALRAVVTKHLVEPSGGPYALRWQAALGLRKKDILLQEFFYSCTLWQKCRLSVFRRHLLRATYQRLQKHRSIASDILGEFQISLRNAFLFIAGDRSNIEAQSLSPDRNVLVLFKSFLPSQR